MISGEKKRDKVFHKNPAMRCSGEDKQFLVFNLKNNEFVAGDYSKRIMGAGGGGVRGMTRILQPTKGHTQELSIHPHTSPPSIQ